MRRQYTPPWFHKWHFGGLGVIICFCSLHTCTFSKVMCSLCDLLIVFLERKEQRCCLSRLFKWEHQLHFPHFESKSSEQLLFLHNCYIVEYSQFMLNFLGFKKEKYIKSKVLIQSMHHIVSINMFTVTWLSFFLCIICAWLLSDISNHDALRPHKPYGLLMMGKRGDQVPVGSFSKCSNLQRPKRPSAITKTTRLRWWGPSQCEVTCVLH